MLSPQDGSGDEIRLVEHDGRPVVLFVRGRDRRSLLGRPVLRGVEPGRDAPLAACRELSSRADETEADAKAEGRWDAIDPRRVAGKA